MPLSEVTFPVTAHCTTWRPRAGSVRVLDGACRVGDEGAMYDVYVELNREQQSLEVFVRIWSEADPGGAWYAVSGTAWVQELMSSYLITRSSLTGGQAEPPTLRIIR